MTRRLRVVHQGASIYVMGTEDIQLAKTALPGDVTGWNGSFSGLYVRRQGYLRRVSDYGPVPMDAKPGVAFMVVKHTTEAGGQR